MLALRPCSPRRFHDAAGLPVKPGGFMDHRWGNRHATNLPVSFTLRSGTRGLGRVLNISTTGAYLQTELPLRVLLLIDVKFTDDGVTPSERFAAFVVRGDGNGVGIEWQVPLRLTTAISRTATNSLGIELRCA